MDSDAHPLIGFAVFVILLIIDFLLTGYGMAIQDVTDGYLELNQRGGNSKAESAAHLKDEPDGFIHACWFFLILSPLPAVIAAYAYPMKQRILMILVSMILLYLFGKALPRLLGRRFAEKWSISLSGAVHVLIAVSAPFVFLPDLITMGILRMFGIRRDDLDDEVTEDEIIDMVNEGHEQGVLDEHEAEMIQNIFDLDDKEARDIMTHRKNICAIDADMKLTDAIEFMVQQVNSRFPFYRGSIDNIIGVLHFKDAVICIRKGADPEALIRAIPELVRPVRFIPETRDISVLFRNMQAEKQQMVVVVDEYGETAGLVTMEDILEEIVGNILDEYDVEEKQIIRQDRDTYLMAGMTPLEDVESTLKIEFQADDYDTLNGYLIGRLDRIPEDTEKSVIEEQGWSFAITEVRNKTIRWIKVKRISDSDLKEKKE